MPASSLADLSITEMMHQRYTCKSFAKDRRIPDAKFAELEQVMRQAPSSVNSQPWHYIIASSEEGKAKIAQSTQGGMSYNAPKVLNASHVVVFCRQASLQPERADLVVDQEMADGRFSDSQAAEARRTTCRYYFNENLKTSKDGGEWMNKQVYLSFGMVILAAASLGIDACPMEGFEHDVLDKVLSLPERGLKSVVLLALGYRAQDDFNAKLPKSRLPASQIFTHI